MISVSAPVYACGMHGAFGVPRFNPFQTAQSDAPSSSWNDALNQNRASIQRPTAPAADEPMADEEPANKTWLDQQNADGDDSNFGPAQIGRSDDQTDFKQDNWQSDQDDSLTSADINGLEADRAMLQ